jgi:hypothetical protein
MRVFRELLHNRRVLEFRVDGRYARVWLRPFCAPYYFDTYGPRCFGFAWLGVMIFPLSLPSAPSATEE